MTLASLIDLTPDATEALFWNALVFIASACLFAPLVRRAGLGTVLGYLLAGLAIQLAFPATVAANPEKILHFAEFGVVLFLFVIGLELKPTSLMAMRRDILGLGLAQVAVCGLVLALAGLAAGLAPAVATVVGFGMALSSTALVMQTLDEQGARGALHGRKAFAILLFQDLAIVPLLLLVAFLAPVGAPAGGAAGAPDGGTMGMAGGLAQLAVALAVIGLLVAAGHYLLDPMFRLLARARMPELMTASALGVVIAAALVVDAAGMSYAMGAFLAGVMLADSAYRHEVEANVEPFRGLFLALFFIAVGLSLDLDAVAANWAAILVAAPLAMALKAAAIWAVALAFAERRATAMRLALGLSQAGEFGFVLFAAAGTQGVIAPDLASTLIAIVTLTMALSPLLARVEARIEARFAAEPAPIDESFHDAGGQVLVIGFGRFGQVVAQPLFAQGLSVTILDCDAVRVREAQAFGFRVHYGDGTRRDVLRAAGAGEAKTLVVAVNDPTDADIIVALAKAEFPEARLFVRAYDRRHSIRLMKAEVDFSVRETFESALKLGRRVLHAHGADEQTAVRVVADIRRRDLERLKHQAEGDMRSGLDRLHTRPVRPEPLERLPEPTVEEVAEALDRSPR